MLRGAPMSGIHDRLVRYTFNHPEEAAAELRAVLAEREHTVRLGFRLDDLGPRQTEELMARLAPPLTRLMLFFLRYGRTEEFISELMKVAEVLARLHASPQGRKHLAALVRYLHQLRDASTLQAVRGVLDSTVGEQQAEEVMRTMAEELIDQGVQKGWAKGRAESVLEVLLARGVQIGDRARERILSCRDQGTLDAWFSRALSATTLSDVLGDQVQ